MSPLSLGQLLILYAWFPLAALLFFLLLIARFYQKFSGERTYFRLYVLPVALFGVAAVRYASLDQMSADLLGDSLQAVAGLILLGLSLRLYAGMVYRRSPLEKK